MGRKYPRKFRTRDEYIYEVYFKYIDDTKRYIKNASKNIGLQYKHSINSKLAYILIDVLIIDRLDTPLDLKLRSEAVLERLSLEIKTAFKVNVDAYDLQSFYNGFALVGFIERLTRA